MRIRFEYDGYQVVPVSTGQQALDRVEDDTPEMRIAEAEGLGAIGREICAIMKKNIRLRHIPVICVRIRRCRPIARRVTGYGRLHDEARRAVAIAQRSASGGGRDSARRIAGFNTSSLVGTS